MSENSAHDAFASLAGGPAAKIADLFERAWTVGSLLDLISGEIVELRLEEQDPDGLGVEFSRVTVAGNHEYHSVKRQAPDSAGRWTPSEITRKSGPRMRSFLGDLFGHLGRDETTAAVFVSQDAVQHLREASERARQAVNLSEFHGLLSAAQRRAWDKHVVPLAERPDEAYAKFRTCEFVNIEHRQLVRWVEQRISALIAREDSEPVDAEQLRTLLEGFAWSRLGQSISHEDLAHKLAAHGYRTRAPLAGSQAGQQLRAITDAYIGRIERTLINGAAIPRSQSESVANDVLSGDRSLLLLGEAGVGKSCVMAQVVRALRLKGVVCFAFPASDLRGAMSAKEVGQRMGLRESPVGELALAARGRPAVLCIDQLDGLAADTERNELGHRVLHALADEASHHPNLRVLFACRSFDLDEASSLAWVHKGDSAIARKVEVLVLTVGDVTLALDDVGIAWQQLTAEQIELLRVPLHLYLFIEAAQSRQHRFATVDDLFDAYWKEKSTKVSTALPAANSGWAASVSRLCHALSEHEAYSVPDYELLDYFPAEALAMASEAVISLEQGEVGFFHDAFSDYAFARTFATERRDLLKWLEDDRQDYYRRRQVIAVLTFIRRRPGDRARYLQSVERLLAGPELHFHIKRRIIDWLRSIADPLAEEWSILEQLEGQLGDHVWRVVSNSVPWFDLLMQTGHWKRWLSGSDEWIDLAVGLLQSPRLLDERTPDILDLIEQHQDGSEGWRNRMWSLARWESGYREPRKRAWLLELLASESPDSPVLSLNGELLIQVLHGVRQHAPEFATRVIGAWFDHVLAELARVDEPEPCYSDLYLGSTGWEMEQCAKAAPVAFVEELFPRLVRLEQNAPLQLLTAPSGTDSPRRGLRELVGEAMILAAHSEPKALHLLAEDVDRRGDRWTRWMNAVMLAAMSANPEEFADAIVQFLLADPDRRLDSGYDHSNGAELFLSVSRRAVAAAALHCSDPLLRDIECAILEIQPTRPLVDESREKIELALLWCLPEDRIGSSVRSRIQELEAQLPEVKRRGAPEPVDYEEAFQYAESPIPEAEALSTSDDEWLDAMRNVGGTSATFHGDRFIGGAHELSRTLERAARRDPARFASLALRLEATDRPEYFSGLLLGLTGSEPDSPRAGTQDQVTGVIRRIVALGVDMPKTEIARAIGSLADEPIPNDMIRSLCRIASEDPDPAEDAWIGPEGSMAAINQAINTARGAAAEAIAKLLFAERNRWDLVKDTVHRLAEDPVLAVRATTAHCLLAILPTNQDEALECFARLIEEGAPIADSHYVRHFVARAANRDYTAIRPILKGLVASDTDAAARVGASAIVGASLGPDNPDAQEDARMVAEMGEQQRSGAAEVYATHVADERVGAICAARLSALFSDDSELVREAAARCWYRFTPDQVAGQGSLIGAFAQSKAFEEARISILLNPLERTNLALPLQLCDLTERALDSFGEKASSIRFAEAFAAKTLGVLMFRLLDGVSDPDGQARIRALIDRMIEANFYGVAEELERRLGE